MNIVQGLYAIYDSQAEHFLPPFSSHNDNTAIRQFSNAVAQEGHEFNLHPQDFTLNRTGSVDSKTGQITPSNPEIISEAWRLQAQQLGDLASITANS